MPAAQCPCSQSEASRPSLFQVARLFESASTAFREIAREVGWAPTFVAFASLAIFVAIPLSEGIMPSGPIKLIAWALWLANAVILLFTLALILVSWIKLRAKISEMASEVLEQADLCVPGACDLPDRSSSDQLPPPAPPRP